MPSLTGRWAYLLLFALVAAESAGVPIPGEAALIAAGSSPARATSSFRT